MADDARQPRPDLAALDGLDPAAIDFFELLRRLERAGGLFARSGRPDREPARLGQHIRQGFALQDVATFLPGGDGGPARVTVANIGLMGPEGPMPLHLTRWVLDRLSQRWFSDTEEGATRDTTFVDFANLLQHRLIGLYYRAWADTRPEVQAERNGGGRVQALLAALGGIGLSGPRDPRSDELDALKLRQAPALGHQVDGPERLTRFLADALAVPVRLGEFVGAWIPVPARLQTRLGQAHVRLGRTATIGPRSFQRQTRIEIRLGPLSRTEFDGFLPGGARLGLACRAIRHVIGEVLDVDLRLVLAGAEVPAAKLGAARLGRSGWLAPRGRADAGDLRLRSLVGVKLDAAA